MYYLSSKDGGDTWSKIKSPTTNSLGSIIAVTKNNLLAVGISGTVISSKDGGDTWSNVKSPTYNWLSSIVAVTKNNLVAVGSSGTVISSKDGGSTWSNVKSPTYNWLSSIVAVTKNNLVAVGSGGAIISSKDGGDTWSNIDARYNIDFKKGVIVNNNLLLGTNINSILKLNLATKKLEQLPYSFTYGIFIYISIIFMIITIIAFILVVLSYVTKEENTEKSDIKSDKAINSMSQDRYGYSTITATIVTLLTSSQTKTPLCLAINGKWGSGKSSIVDTSANLLYDYGIKSFVFNVWHYQNEKNLLSALMRQFLNNLVPDIFSFANIFFRMKLFFYRVLKNPNKLIALLLLILSIVFINNVFFEKVSQQIQSAIVEIEVFIGMLFAITKLKTFSDNINSFIKPYKSILSLKDFDKDIGLRDEFKKELEILIKSSGGRITLFIDDLDRCGDKDILSIMKTVNFLSSINNLYIIMAVDKDKVIDAIEREYKIEQHGNKDSRERAKSYIEKIFQLSINIPDINSEFAKDKQFRLSALEAKIYEYLDETRKIKKFILKYFIFFAIGALAYFAHPFISNQYKDLVSSSKQLEIVKLLSYENNTTNIIKNTSIKIENNDTKTTNVEKVKIPRPTSTNNATIKENILPQKRKKNSFFQNAIMNIGFFTIGALIFGTGAIILGSLSIYRIRKESEKQDTYILSVANNMSDTPRQAKIIYNEVKAIALIGKKEFYLQNIFFASIKGVALDIIFKPSIYLYFVLNYFIKLSFTTHKWKQYHNELLSMLLGSSKTKKEDIKNFQTEISNIISYIKNEQQADTKSFSLKTKLSIIPITDIKRRKNKISNYSLPNPNLKVNTNI